MDKPLKPWDESFVRYILNRFQNSDSLHGSLFPDGDKPGSTIIPDHPYTRYACALVNLELVDEVRKRLGISWDDRLEEDGVIVQLRDGMWDINPHWIDAVGSTTCEVMDQLRWALTVDDALAAKINPKWSSFSDILRANPAVHAELKLRHPNYFHAMRFIARGKTLLASGTPNAIVMYGEDVSKAATASGSGTSTGCSKGMRGESVVSNGIGGVSDDASGGAGRAGVITNEGGENNTVGAASTPTSVASGKASSRKRKATRKGTMELERTLRPSTISVRIRSRSSTPSTSNPLLCRPFAPLALDRVAGDTWVYVKQFFPWVTTVNKVIFYLAGMGRLPPEQYIRLLNPQADWAPTCTAEAASKLVRGSLNEVERQQLWSLVFETFPIWERTMGIVLQLVWLVNDDRGQAASLARAVHATIDHARELHQQYRWEAVSLTLFFSHHYRFTHDYKIVPETWINGIEFHIASQYLVDSALHPLPALGQPSRSHAPATRDVGVPCDKFNREANGCTGERRCPAGRPHVCAQCHGRHRLCGSKVCIDAMEALAKSASRARKGKGRAKEEGIA